MFVAIGCAVLVIALFVFFHMSLGKGVQDLHDALNYMQSVTHEARV